MKTRKMKARQKFRWWLAGCTIIVAVLAGLLAYGIQAPGESRLMLDFADALEAEDAFRIGKLVYADQGDEPIGERDAKRLLAYLAENNLLDRALDDIARSATAQGENGKRNHGDYSVNSPSSTNGTDSVTGTGSTSTGSNSSDSVKGANRTNITGRAGSPLFAIQRDDWFGLFQRARIVVSTSYVEVHTNLAGTSIQLEDERVATADSDDYRAKIGPLVPGRYRLEATFNGEYAKLNREAFVTVDGDHSPVVVDLSLNGGMVAISASDAPATIYLDGQQIGTAMGVELAIGPLALNGTNTVHAEKTYPWGIARSREVPVDSRNIRLEIDPNTEALKDEVIHAVAAFILSYMEAYSKLDPGLIRHLSADRVAQLADGMEAYRSFGFQYEAKPQQLAFDLDSIYVQAGDDDVYRVAVSVRNTYLQRHFTAEEPLPPFEEVTETVTYRLSLEGDQWIINNWIEEPNFSNKNLKLHGIEVTDAMKNAVKDQQENLIQ
jgi:hypothetical protein